MRYIKTELRYKFRAITTDIDLMLEKSIKTILRKDIPHQLYLQYSMDNIYRILRYRPQKIQLSKLEKEINSKNDNIKPDNKSFVFN